MQFEVTMLVSQVAGKYKSEKEMHACEMSKWMHADDEEE